MITRPKISFNILSPSEPQTFYAINYEGMSETEAEVNSHHYRRYSLDEELEKRILVSKKSNFYPNLMSAEQR
jgi:hypothetical protein